MEIYDKLIRKSWGGPINGFYGNYFRGKAIMMQVSKEKMILRGEYVRALLARSDGIL